MPKVRKTPSKSIEKVPDGFVVRRLKQWLATAEGGGEHEQAVIKKLNELWRKRISEKDSRALLLAAVRPGLSQDLQGGLVRATTPYPALLGELKGVFAKGGVWIRGLVLGKIGRLHTRRAAKLYLELIPQLGEATSNANPSPAMFKMVWSELLRFPLAVGFEYELASLYVEYFHAGHLSGEHYVAAAEYFSRAAERRLPLCEKYAGRGAAFWSADHGPAVIGETREILEALALSAQTPAVCRALRRALRSPDVEARCSAVIGLVRAGINPPKNVVLRVASAPSTRNRLHEELAKVDRLDLYPAAFAAREFFAEARLAEWLAHPFEYGRPPARLVLVAHEQADTVVGPGHLYFYKYRYPKEGWELAVSGAFFEGETSGPYRLGCTGNLGEFSQRLLETSRQEFREALPTQAVRYVEAQNSNERNTSARELYERFEEESARLRALANWKQS